MLIEKLKMRHAPVVLCQAQFLELRDGNLQGLCYSPHSRLVRPALRTLCSSELLKKIPTERISFFSD